MCEQQKKDFNLLRPFDLEKVKAGDPICYKSGEGSIQYLAGPDSIEHIAYKSLKQDRIFTGKIYEFRMKPLCWVEGKPVYMGDILFGKWTGANPKGYKINNASLDGIPVTGNGVILAGDISEITWTPRKVKREGWMNCYSEGEKCVYPTRDTADRMAGPTRIDCIRIEWEE